jgi:DNA repair exonuclease SbcCD ATPase subunit
MDSTFVWILVFAGAAVALLGLFLLASERELRAKRREIEKLVTQLGNAGAGVAPVQPFTPQAGSAAELSDLRAQNRELQNQLTALASKFEFSQRKVHEIEASQQKSGDDPADTQRIRGQNEQLNRDLTELRTRFVQERQSLEERIAGLEGQLAAEREKLSEFPTMRDRLTEAENMRMSLQEEIRRHEADIELWQARIAEAEKNGQRLAALQRPYHDLLSKQAALAEGQRQIQEELASFARFIGTPVQTTQSPSSVTGASASSVMGNGDPLQTAPVPSVSPEAPRAQAEIVDPAPKKPS